MAYLDDLGEEHVLELQRVITQPGFRHLLAHFEEVGTRCHARFYTAKDFNEVVEARGNLAVLRDFIKRLYDKTGFTPPARITALFRL